MSPFANPSYASFVCFLALICLLAGPTAASASFCSGDCDGNGEVTIDEVLRAMRVALGAEDLASCRPVERNDDGEVSVEEVIFALQMALQGCPRREFLHGMNMASWWRGQFAEPAAEDSLDQLAETAVDTVVVVPTWYVDTSTDSSIYMHEQKTSSFGELADILDDAKRRGFRTVLKPHVDSFDGLWRGRLQPADLDSWFADYTVLITETARLANQAGSDVLVVATEFQSLTRAEHHDRWRAVVAAVREVYGGHLAYAANWDGYEDVAIWDLVDVVGINGYFPLSDQRDPTDEELLKAWLGDGWIGGDPGWMNVLLEWFGVTFPGTDKRLMFTEIGYVAGDYSVRRPWEMEDDCFSGERPYNAALQLRAYQALVDAGAGALDGIFWWHWEPFPVRDAEGSCRFTPQGKAAETWLAEDRF